MELSSTKAWTAQLSKAEADISKASSHLEYAFRQAGQENLQSGGPHIPNPVKLIRRLTALETALGQLRQDCETISKKRNDIVQNVIAKQCQNVADVERLLEARASERIVSRGGGTNPRRHVGHGNMDLPEDRNWGDLFRDLNYQAEILTRDKSGRE